MFDLFYPFDWLSSRLVTQVFRLPLESSLGSSLHFFFYDVPKVLTLLVSISFVIGILQSFLSPKQVRSFLEHQKLLVGNILAASLGAVTPFCSCSAVPLFIGFLSAGVPLGVTFSYLISAPMVDAVAVALLWGLFGIQATLMYVGFGVALAVMAGLIIGQLHLEGWLEPFLLQLQAQATQLDLDKRANNSNLDPDPAPQMSWRSRIQQAWFQTYEILQSVWMYMVIGIGIGAAIHGYVPTDLVTRWAGRENPLAVLVAVLLGVPLYANVAGVLPIAEALVNKGMPIGTVLSFTMAVTALSLPEMVILRKVLRPQLLFVFVSLTSLGIIMVGYLFNFLLV